MPGQTRYPKSSTAVSATPEAGHTGEMLLLVNGVERPILPAAKYATKTTST